MNCSVEIDELATIIRQLMFFIVSEGKECVDEHLKKEYIDKYVLLFAKLMNQTNSHQDSQQIIDLINKDLEQQFLKLM